VSSFASDVLSPTSEVEAPKRSIVRLLCALATTLGDLFDAFHFVKAIVKVHSGTSKTMTSVNTTAWLIFECSLLTTRTMPSLQTALGDNTSRNQRSSSTNFDMVDEEELECFREKIMGLRRDILQWCSNDLCRLYKPKIIQEEDSKCSEAYCVQGAVTNSPGAPDYNSVLGVDSTGECGDHSSAFKRMMSIIRCVLFLSPPSSKELQTFSAADDEDSQDRYHRISFCCQYVDISDEMLQIIIASSNMTPNTAISVIENLIFRCGSSGRINCTADIVWNVYKLAEYSPVFRSDLGTSEGKNSDTSGDDEGETEVSDRMSKNRADNQQSVPIVRDRSKLPR
jgi:hypothetical protein